MELLPTTTKQFVLIVNVEEFAVLTMGIDRIPILYASQQLRHIVSDLQTLMKPHLENGFRYIR